METQRNLFAWLQENDNLEIQHNCKDTQPRRVPHKGQVYHRCATHGI